MESTGIIRIDLIKSISPSIWPRINDNSELKLKDM
jgi:hypothetical protein